MAAFSIGIYLAEKKEFERIVIKQDFGQKVPKILSKEELDDIKEQVAQLENTFALNLLYLNIMVLFLSACLNILFAKRELEPLQESMEREKDFVANVSHELRTPLASIQAASEIALKLANRSVSDYKKTLGQINDQTIKMARILDNLLTLSRLGAGHEVLTKSKVSINKVVEEAITTIKPLASEKHITITKNLNPEVTVLGDAEKLKELVEIILDNAVKYTDSSGKITVSLKTRPLRHLSISDTGQGISPEEKQFLFDRFYRGTKTKTRGAGIGLSIAKWIVDAHGFNIRVKSLEGKGSEFIIYFS